MVERRRIVPPLDERREHVEHRRPADLDHRVMPRRTPSVARIHRLALVVPGMGSIVTPGVTEIDAANEGHVIGGSLRMTDDDRFLMV